MNHFNSGMVRSTKLLTAFTLVCLSVFSLFPGCVTEQVANPLHTPGSTTQPATVTVSHLTPAANQTVATVGNTAGFVASQTPPGSTANNIATIVMGIAGIVLGVDGYRKNSNSGKLAETITKFNEFLSAYNSQQK